ncbi:MAG: PorP/SprF family type IX secretion system membrane protein [Bacteroidota bacterium]
MNRIIYQYLQKNATKAVSIKCLKLILVVFMVYMSFYSFSQDIHFSQFYNSTTQLNPALCGLYNGTYRFSGIYRNQWANVPVNYNTAKLGVEYKAIQSAKAGNLNIGLSYYYDKAGDSRYTTMLPNLTLGYSKTFGKSISHTIGIAITSGIIYKQISYAALQFDAQYNGEFYDANAPSFENAGIAKNTVLDVGSGLVYQIEKNKKWSFQLGYSVAHINRPNYSFLGNSDIKLNMRHTIHGKFGIALGKKTSTQIQLVYQRQDSKQEFVAGFVFKNQLSTNLKNSIILYYGPFYRVNDAAIVLVGIEYNSLNIGFSYDINTSSFLKGTNTYGATELSVQYVLAPIKKIKLDKSICPIF